MSHWTSFIGSMIASKVLVDDTRIPFQFYEALKPTITEIESWSKTFNSLEIEKPHTWVKTGMSVLERVSNVRDPYTKIASDMISTAMDRLNFKEYEFNHASPLISDAMTKANVHLVYEEKPERLYRVLLPNEEVMFMKTGMSYKDLVKNTTKDTASLNGTFYIHKKDKQRKETLKGIGDLFWEGKGPLVLDKSSSYKNITYKALRAKYRGYDGEALHYIKEWENFMDKGIRRCILLQGEPGTGKSTLAKDASKSLAKRTLHLTSSFLLNVTRNEWEVLNSVLKPDVMVVDDIDRINEDYLANRLYFFEDAYHQVPLTILTANHYTNLPDAFLRPGRIDQILELDDPDDSKKEEILRSLAKKEGISSIPPSKMKVLMKVYQNYSGAYVVEYLRRVKVLGWGYQIPKKDLTFEKIYGIEETIGEGSSSSSSEKTISFTVVKEMDEENGRKILNINPVKIN